MGLSQDVSQSLCGHYLAKWHKQCRVFVCSEPGLLSLRSIMCLIWGGVSLPIQNLCAVAILSGGTSMFSVTRCERCMTEHTWQKAALSSTFC